MNPSNAFDLVLRSMFHLAFVIPIFPALAEPVVVADDPFTDGEHFTSGGDPLGLIWFQAKLNLHVVDEAEGLGDGKALHLKPAAGFSSFSTHFPGVMLDADGDSLTVEFDYLLPAGLPDIGAGIRLGVYDSAGTLRTADQGHSTCNDDSGYGVSSNPGGGGERGSNCFRELGGNDILGGPEPMGTKEISGGKRGPSLPADGARHHLRLTVTRLIGGALEIHCSVDDRELASASEPADAVLKTSFDEFALGFAGTDNHGEIIVDNFRVTASTQQPLKSMVPKQAPAAAPVFRQWTNQQGRQIEAVLLSYDPEAAAIKVAMRDGREFNLPINALSTADTAYIGEVADSLLTPPLTGADAWKVQSLEPLTKATAKFESTNALLKNLRSGHPRLMMLEEDWVALKGLTKSDPIAEKLYSAVQTSGNDFLNAPSLEYVLPDGIRLLETSRAFVARVYVLGILHRLDGDPKWSARAIEEMFNVCSFKDWNPSHFLDVGEMVHGMAIGYDWFYDQLSESERTRIRQAILDKAFAPAMLVYARPSGWHRGEHLNNWNHVCNGGLITAALAIADEEPRESQRILETALESLEPAMNLYLPDGAWDEGPAYWDYATNYVITASEALRTATGSDGGISASPGFDKAAEFMLHATGSTGESFNFADAGASDWNIAALNYMGRRFQRTDYSSMFKSHVDKFGTNAKWQWFRNAHGLIWFDRQGNIAEWQQAACDRIFRRIEMVSLRTSWDENAWSILAKGGDNRFSHGNLDLGTFVLDALGMRWGIDLGADSYALPGYFGAERFTHYRTSSKGQNTLTWDHENQELDGTGFVETFESTAAKSWAVLDLSKGYSTAKEVRRGILLTRGESPSILIQDEFLKPKSGNLVWAMHTHATVDCTGNVALLGLGGRQLRVTILRPENAVFQVEDVDLKEPAYPTEDTRKLIVKIPVDGGDATLAVRFSSVNDDSPLPPPIPLAKWGGKPVPR